MRPSLSEVRLDLGHAARDAAILAAAFRGGDDHLLSGIGRIFEQHGFRMIGVKDVAPDLLMPQGCITRTMPDGAATGRHRARDRTLLAALSPFDVGQAVVVIDGHVVAVEDIEGTDGLLARVAQLRDDGTHPRQGRAAACWSRRRRAARICASTCRRFGPRTVEGAIAAGLAGIAIVAGQRWWPRRKR